MNAKQLRAIEARMRGLETPEIVEMLGPDRDGWRPEAIEIAEGELRRRGIAEERIQELRGWKTMQAQRFQHAIDDLLETISQDESADDCHLCGSPQSTAVVAFGLAALVEADRKMDLGATTVISAIALPLLGAGVLISRGQSTQDILRLKLRLCASCQEGKRWMGRLDLVEEDYRQHPAYAQAEVLGFTRLMWAEHLPAGGL